MHHLEDDLALPASVPLSNHSLDILMLSLESFSLKIYSVFPLLPSGLDVYSLSALKPMWRYSVALDK